MSLLDFHQDLLSAVFQGEGFPAWAVLTDGLPIPPSAELPGSYASNAALQRAFDNFWANRAGPDGVALQDRYAAAWAHVARRCRDAPGILGFDISNEPFPGSEWESCAVATGCPRLDASLLTPFSRRVLGAIREVDDVHIVWYEAWVLFDAGVPTALGKLDDPRVGMSFHDYLPRDDYRLPLDNAERHSERTGDALLMTEFGATADPAVILQILNAADRAMMSRLYWAYSNRTPFPVVAPPGSVATAEQQGLVLDPSQPLTGDCPEVSPSTRVEALEGNEHGALAVRRRPAVAGAGHRSPTAVVPLRMVVRARHARLPQIGNHHLEVAHEEGHNRFQVLPQ